MEFIEDQQAHAIQCGVILQAPGQDAFGDHFDARAGADLAVEPDPIAHRFTDFFTQLAGQPLRRSPRGQASWLEHQDGLPRQPRLIEQGQRNPSGLARTGRRFEHSFVACRQRFTQGG